MRNVLALIVVLKLAASTVGMAQHWPAWRGPTHNGVSAETRLPDTWEATCADTAADFAEGSIGGPSSEAIDEFQRGQRPAGTNFEGRPIVPTVCNNIQTKNVAWRLPLPAYSGSTPIIWGDTIFLNVATGTNTGALELWAIDRNKPAALWKRQIAPGNHMNRKQNMSSPSPVTDGKHVWVMTGVGILKAFDFAGKPIWMRDIQSDYGRFGLNWGYASTPLLKGDALYVPVLHGMKTDDPSYILKIDKLTGKTVWKVERPNPAVRESPDAYITPAWIEANGRAELIITGGDVVSGHDPATGKEYWRADVLNPERNGAYRIIASPTIVNDLVIAPTRVGPMVAMRPGGSGDVAKSHVQWTFMQGPDVPTPVSDGKLLYVVRDTGVAFGLDVKTGATVYGPVRLPSGTYSASPILADGKIYVTTEEEGLTRCIAPARSSRSSRRTGC